MVSKVLESVSIAQLQHRLLSCADFFLFPPRFHSGHFTKTALLELLNNIYTVYTAVIIDSLPSAYFVCV